MLTQPAITPTLILAVLICVLPRHLDAGPPVATTGDRICIVGNTFAERMRIDGFLETRLAVRRPDLKLTVRNLGWSGDTVELRPRPLNFGSLNEHLARQQADIVLCCFGMSEAFDDSVDITTFRQSLLQFVRNLQNTTYNGQAPPKVVLVTPIALETVDPRVDDVDLRTERLQAISRTISEVAEQTSSTAVDLHTPTGNLIRENPSQRLTDNGIHPNEYGYWATTAAIADALVGPATAWSVDVDTATQSVETSDDANGALQVTLLPQSDDQEAMRLRVQTTQLLPPTAPPDSLIHPSLSNLLPVLTVRGLPEGRYGLFVDGTVVAEADSGQWAAGQVLSGLPAAQRTEDLRTVICQKNEWFFHRYRPANSEYVFGRRTKPFGSVSFPPEMKAFDRLVEQSDGTIHGLSRQKRTETWSLERID
ncbi:SGNH/GDSL hydrolase family protein [Maioricimonas sp. JC845]|uniref:SGNH/GDSL hydrolase family protein n=1 Tax=Maioricimonas sp. JC845 TaxID=3232138 RepID=UPI003458CF7A